MKSMVLITLLCASCVVGLNFPAEHGLTDSFRTPPAAARPWVYWFIMDGNFSREGVTADLEAMQRVGIGGVILMEVDVGIPRGPVKFMSKEWRGLFRHAVDEAERLGLEITLNAGPGWTGSGGPWVKPEHSMQHLVASAVDVAGPSRFDAILPRPQPRKPYFDERGLPPELLKKMQDFYLDVAVLAVPKTPEDLIADLALGAAADVPMCEFWAAGDGFETAFSCFEAASIAHTHGRPIVAAEAFTGAGRYSWTRHPATMKNQADWAFCAGINRLVFHRYAHQPWLDRVPGMTMGPYGTQYERTQTWWEFSRPSHEYLARCQFLLRRGLPVADVLFLTPEGAPHVFQAPLSALGGSREMPDRRGYNFDACDPDALLTRASVKDGKIAFPDGMSYRVLVLPEVGTITPGLLRKVKSLLQEGAVVVGMRPKRSPSLADYPRCDDEVRRLTAEIWRPHSPAAAPARLKVGKGLLVASAASDQLRDAAGRDESPQLYGNFRQLETLLADLGVDPDFESDKNLRYIHRRAGATEIYFVSNPANYHINAGCTFRVSGKTAELWDPTNGRMAIASDITQSRGRTQVPISLEPYGSIFVIFSPAARSRPAPKEAMSPILQPITEISGPWEVRFQPGRGAPETITLSSLIDLSEHAENGIRFFSGTATYRTTFSLPQSGKAPGQRFFLDLRRVEVVARVKLNGQDLGIAWRVPFQLEATQALRSAGNLLEIEVANLWPNRLIGDQAMPARQRLAWTTRNPFAKNSPLPASGLIGPVVILSSR